MESILTFLIGAVPATMFVVALAKKVIKRVWPQSKLDPTVVILLTAAANFAVAWTQFGETTAWPVIAVASIAAAYGAKVGYDATRGLERTHSGGE